EGILFTLLLFFITGSIHAQSKGLFRGNVYEKNSAQPIAFATVSIENTKYFTETDLNGFFAIGEIVPGNYTAVISYLGFADYIIDFSIKPGEIVYNRIYMESQDIELDAVEISGKK